MDNLAHSLVGLTAAKAGLEKLSPYATTVCVISANLADADFISLFLGDRWTLLQSHRGITHSIVGTVGIGLLVPAVFLLIERVWLRERKPRIRPLGLVLASLIAASTHPLLDWTNNYGVRPLLPWNPRWFYGDLVFIVDPYIWLGLGAVAFLLTSEQRWKLFGWSFLGAIATLVIVIASLQSNAVKVALAIWLITIVCIGVLRFRHTHRLFGSRTAVYALLALVVYWLALTATHSFASSRTSVIAQALAAQHNERLLRTATMPSEATPFRWQAIAETESAYYKFEVTVGGGVNLAGDFASRFEKPAGTKAQLISIAENDRRARALLGFARFPLARTSSDNCLGQTLVQLADLRYTEPGRGRGNFSVNIPVDCDSK
jgi:inner membrane protein